MPAQFCVAGGALPTQKTLHERHDMIEAVKSLIGNVLRSGLLQEDHIGVAGVVRFAVQLGWGGPGLTRTGEELLGVNE